jgi:hypothetical protein
MSTEALKRLGSFEMTERLLAGLRSAKAILDINVLSNPPRSERDRAADETLTRREDTR